MKETQIDGGASPTGPRCVAQMRPAETREHEAHRSTEPKGYAEPRPTPVQVMTAIKRPPA